jgi:eukaryotic-like serine/threonine-protein kinase
VGTGTVGAAVPESTASDDLSPTVAVVGRLVGGRYRLTRLIASGGMAEVWEAHDEVLERHVAVKLLHRHLASDRTFTQRFKAEAVAAARLHHPSIVSIYDTSTEEGLEAIVMELVRGRTLRDYLDERGRLDPIEVVHIGADVADALQAAHRAHVVHRDVKPANILLCDDERVMVTDFGIAKVRDDSDLTNTGTMLGTVKYLAPEQVEGNPVDGRTDVYGLGVVLYEALAGRPPFDADTAAATALARLHQEPPPLQRWRPDVPHALAAVVMRALSRDPARRFASAAELRAALLTEGTAAPGVDPDATSAAPAPEPTAWGPRPTATAGTGPSRTPAPSGDPVAPSRQWILPTLMLLLVGASIGVAIALLARTQDSGGFLDGVPGIEQGAPTPPVRITGIQDFDPQGDGREHPDKVAFVLDGDPTTLWRTETYNSRDFGSISKNGVGIFVQLDRDADLSDLVVESPSRDWSAQVYVADRAADTIDGWGEPVDERRGIDGDTRFDLDDARGRAVLLWITELPSDVGRVEISSLSLTT